MTRCGPDAIDPSLPFIKQEAVAVLSNPYHQRRGSTKQHRVRNTAVLPGQVSSTGPQAQSQSIATAVSRGRRIYRSTIFPAMKTDWRSHPDNVGHLYSPGCFRCHDGQHASAEGKVIPKDCNTCHTIQAQLEGAATVEAPAPPTSFSHPVDIGDLTQVNCSDCHSGGVGP